MSCVELLEGTPRRELLVVLRPGALLAHTTFTLVNTPYDTFHYSSKYNYTNLRAYPVARLVCCYTRIHFHKYIQGGKQIDPHWWPQGLYTDERVEVINMTPEQIPA